MTSSGRCSDPAKDGVRDVSNGVMDPSRVRVGEDRGRERVSESVRRSGGICVAEIKYLEEPGTDQCLLLRTL